MVEGTLNASPAARAGHILRGLFLSLAAVTARDSRVIDVGGAHIGALIDRTPPGAGLGAFRLNELLEPLEIALCRFFRDVDLVPYMLDQPLRLILEGKFAPGLTPTDVFKRD